MGALFTLQVTGSTPPTLAVWLAALTLLATAVALLLYVRGRASVLRLRSSETDLREAVVEYREMFEADPMGNFIGCPNGSLIACNQAFCRIVGYDSIEQALERGLAPLVGDTDASSERLLDRLIADGRIDGEEIELRRPDGRSLRVLLYAHGIFRDGSLVRFYGRCLDVTEQKALAERMRNAQKMEAVGLLAGGVAHDFNNALTTIQGHAELLLEESPAGSAIRSDLQEIRQSAERAGRLTRKLLAFSRRRVLRPRTVHLGTLVQDTAGFFRQLLGEDVALELLLEPEPSAIRADPGEIEQLLINLVLNAGEALPRGGQVEIRVQAVTVPGFPAADEHLQKGDYVLLRVTDDGIGMDEHVRARAFEPFFTTREAEGRGLGLATVYGIVQEAGGAVWVDSAPGRGASFSICFPRLIEAHAQREDPALERPPIRDVILAEDEDGVRRLVRRVLEGEGFRVHEARDGRAALTLALGLDQPVGLLVTDVVMPRLRGTELADRLQGRDPSLRVLFMSGYTEADRLRDEALRPGQAFLAKPFSPSALREAVRDLILRPLPAGGA